MLLSGNGRYAYLAASVPLARTLLTTVAPRPRGKGRGHSRLMTTLLSSGNPPSADPIARSKFVLRIAYFGSYSDFFTRALRAGASYGTMHRRESRIICSSRV